MRCIAWQLLLAISTLQTIHAASILCVGSPAARSHYMNLLRVGQELQSRNHSFTVLVSSEDLSNQGVVKTRGFPGLKVKQYAGPPGVGTEEWGSKLTQDPIKVPAESMTLPAVFCCCLLLELNCALQR